MTPILPYLRSGLAIAEWDPATVDVAARVAALIVERRPGTPVEHIGSSSVPGLPGKNVVDLSIAADPADVEDIANVLAELGFQRQSGPQAFPPTRPMLFGSIEHDGRRHNIHAHVHPTRHRVWGLERARDLGFRDALRRDESLRREYADRKRAIAAGVSSTMRYSLGKTEWIRGALDRLGLADPAILPPATIAIIGGGQLGRMLALAARPLGYRVSVLDPDAACPAASVVDRVVVGRYDDVEAALDLASDADVVTVELEHVGIEVMRALDREWPTHPGVWAIHVTQDRVEERRFVESEGARVAPWREVTDDAELSAAARDLGLPLRVKAVRGGYDGRSQVRIASEADIAGAIGRLGRPAGERFVAEQELDFAAELSVVCSRRLDGRTSTFPVARNRHDDGILVESVTPAGVPDSVADEAAELARRLAEGLDLVGTLTVELFLMPDQSLVVNELAPRVHNSGHWTIEGTATSQFEQHIRAITGLPLGSVEPRAGGLATANLLGTGAERDARLTGIETALATPDVHVHLYDKRRVFERRKMGHVTAIAATPDEARARALAAAAAIGWQE
ncbi:MAG: 5-(carboxyamino)imidazole ribonucleotide synthase [Chloroflexota bacterium]